MFVRYACCTRIVVVLDSTCIRIVFVCTHIVLFFLLIRFVFVLYACCTSTVLLLYSSLSSYCIGVALALYWCWVRLVFVLMRVVHVLCWCCVRNVFRLVFLLC